MERLNLSYVSCCSSEVVSFYVEKLKKQLSLKKFVFLHLKINCWLRVQESYNEDFICMYIPVK
jgi:hypothetical protein